MLFQYKSTHSTHKFHDLSRGDSPSLKYLKPETFTAAASRHAGIWDWSQAWNDTCLLCGVETLSHEDVSALSLDTCDLCAQRQYIMWSDSSLLCSIINKLSHQLLFICFPSAGAQQRSCIVEGTSAWLLLQHLLVFVETGDKARTISASPKSLVLRKLLRSWRRHLCGIKLKHICSVRQLWDCRWTACTCDFSYKW